MRNLLLILCVGLLSSCASVEAGKKVVKEVGARAADSGLDASIYAICNGVTVGSVRRRYQRDEKGYAIWNAFCMNEMTKQ